MATGEEPSPPISTSEICATIRDPELKGLSIALSKRHGEEEMRTEQTSDLQVDRYVWVPIGKKEKERARVPLWRQNQGVSLIIALLILLVLTLIGISAISTTTYEVNIAGNERLYNEAFYAADAGIDYFYTIGRSFLPGGDREYLVIPPNTTGTLSSADEGIDLGNSRFNIRWVILRREMGPPEKIEFWVSSEGIVPNLPTAGRVVIEAVIEAISESSQSPYPGGST